MPDCSEQEAAYDLAVIAQTVDAAIWAVKQAEADLANIDLQNSTANVWTTFMAWMYCLMGGDGSRVQSFATEAKSALKEMKTRHLEEVRAYRDEVVSRAKSLGALK